MNHDLQHIGAAFDLRGDFLSAEPYGSGHINDTYAATYSQAGSTLRYIHQRVNPTIFKQSALLMENIARVTRHLRTRLIDEGHTDLTRRVLTLVPTTEGRCFHEAADGACWRTYLFIEGAQTYDQIETTQQAYEAARAFGRFQELLRDLPGDRLHETIPGFHDTPGRFRALEAAIDRDAMGRAKDAASEIAFARKHEAMVGVLETLRLAGELPEVTTHNDTKLNNVMIDDRTSEGICVIDLDTVMPGLSLYDFGDMVRTATRPTLEDERDLSKVTARMDMFEALTRGYLSSAGTTLNEAELEHLAFSARLITLEIGLRFLTDYLEGDVYFKTHRQGHNIDRCRVQFKMLESMEAQHQDMQRIVRNALTSA